VTGGEIRQLSALVSESIASGEKRGLEISDLSAEIEGSAAKIEEIGRAKDSAKEEQARAEAESLEAAASLEDIRNRLSAARAAETAANLEATAAAERSRSAKEIEERIRLGIEELKAERAARLESFREVEARAEETADSDAGAEEKIMACEAEKAAAEDKLRELGEEKKLASASALAIEEERGEADKKLFDKQISKHDATSRLARFGAQTEALKDRLWDEFELSYAQAAERELEDFVMSRAQKESREYRDRIKQLGDVNIGAIEEYKAVKERYDFLTEQRADVVKAMEELRGVINDMDNVIRKQYRESFDLVVTNFEKIFSELFNGGNARLTMSDPEDPLQSTVEIEAQPPGKKLQNINLLSGGEKTMTAIALMFALLKAKPTPFCILDEVEAALDDANIDRFANYLKNFTETQFTLVTHQKATMEHASVLYGVTMAERGISRVLSLKVGDDFDLGN
ncbi:MAG: AAA family ATPase, partial [Firmicutes bacterium]|nr:AAA family ATPase [Bacillota bacterium]